MGRRLHLPPKRFALLALPGPVGLWAFAQPATVNELLVPVVVMLTPARLGMGFDFPSSAVTMMVNALVLSTLTAVLGMT